MEELDATKESYKERTKVYKWYEKIKYKGKNLDRWKKESERERKKNNWDMWTPTQPTNQPKKQWR